LLVAAAVYLRLSCDSYWKHLSFPVSFEGSKLGLPEGRAVALSGRVFCSVLHYFFLLHYNQTYYQGCPSIRYL